MDSEAGPQGTQVVSMRIFYDDWMASNLTQRLLRVYSTCRSTLPENYISLTRRVKCGKLLL